MSTSSRCNRLYTVTDRLDPAARSALMARVRQRDSVPELLVRRLLFSRGWRYRLHARGLPGTPDIVFPRLRAAIFVHGCFWHGHQGCALATVPKTRTEFWNQKVEDNRRRDAGAEERLRTMGWSVLTVWQCETKDQQSLAEKLTCFLKPCRDA
jgi:DNA mismatch endonuclease, patch repair protein